MPFRRSPKLSYSPTREEGAKIARASTKTSLRGRGSGSDFPAHFHGPRKRAARGPSPDRDRTGPPRFARRAGTGGLLLCGGRTAPPVPPTVADSIQVRLDNSSWRCSTGGADRDRTGDLLNAIQALSQTELHPHAGRGREDGTCFYENAASWEDPPAWYKPLRDARSAPAETLLVRRAGLPLCSANGHDGIQPSRERAYGRVGCVRSPRSRRWA